MADCLVIVWDYSERMVVNGINSLLQKDPFDEKVEKIKSEMGLSHIYGEENQRSFDLLVAQMCRLQEMKENTTQHSEDDLSYIMMKQQEVIIEQNYVITRDDKV